MTASANNEYDRWPALPYADFAETQFLLHMSLQSIGKLKLQEPFQPQWAEVPLWLSARGLTTGAIPYAGGAYEVTSDFVSHSVECVTSWGTSGSFEMGSMSVADFVTSLFGMLRKAGVDVTINMKPQEVTNTTPFDQDTEPRTYEPHLVNAWWQILLSTQRVLQIYHGRFKGKTQPIGLMWGTLDIRDVRYNGKTVTPDPKTDYIRRNAMNEELIEVGWWSGNPDYPKPAFYSFTYPQPEEIEKASVTPAKASWNTTMGEFLLDYDDLRDSKDPDADLLSFFESTCKAGMDCAGWNPALLGTGQPE